MSWCTQLRSEGVGDGGRSGGLRIFHREDVGVDVGTFSPGESKRTFCLGLGLGFVLPFLALSDFGSVTGGRSLIPGSFRPQDEIRSRSEGRRCGAGAGGEASGAGCGRSRDFAEDAVFFRLGMTTRGRCGIALRASRSYDCE